MAKSSSKYSIYLVGGAVRDQLLGLDISDRDYVVVGASDQTLRDEGFLQVGKGFPVFLHPKTHCEYALARTEKKIGQAHTDFICDFNPQVSLEMDLKRRDLTVNAIAQNNDGTLIDPYGGQKDIQARCLRHVSDAFSEDPLRVLRVARFLAQLGDFDFHIAPETFELMQQMTDQKLLSALSLERVWYETKRALESTHLERYFNCLQKLGALDTLYPGLTKAHITQAAYAKSLCDDDTMVYAFLCHGLKDIPAVFEKADKKTKQYAHLANHYYGVAINQMARSYQDILALVKALSLHSKTPEHQGLEFLCSCWGHLATYKKDTLHPDLHPKLIDIGKAIAAIDYKALKQESSSQEAFLIHVAKLQLDCIKQVWD